MTLEQRLSTVEQAINQIQQRLAMVTATANWLAQITGSFKDEPAFEEVLEFGRALRAADRPYSVVFPVFR